MPLYERSESVTAFDRIPSHPPDWQDARELGDDGAPRVLTGRSSAPEGSTRFSTLSISLSAVSIRFLWTLTSS
jgi:hypothetical protein